MLTRWTLRFFGGLFIDVLGYATPKHKGKVKVRQVNDPSTLLLVPNDSRSLNSHIDRLYPAAMPPLQYQSAPQNLWCRIYNICLNHTDKDIMIYKYYLFSAFHRIHYHPDVAAAYVFFLGVYLSIPVGMVFGSRDAPSLLCLLSDLSSFAS